MISFVRAVFYWNYDRGSWQWDLACLTFLVIIFATPGDFLQTYTRHPLSAEELHRLVWGFITGYRG